VLAATFFGFTTCLHGETLLFASWSSFLQTSGAYSSAETSLVVGQLRRDSESIGGLRPTVDLLTLRNHQALVNFWPTVSLQMPWTATVKTSTTRLWVPIVSLRVPNSCSMELDKVPLLSRRHLNCLLRTSLTEDASKIVARCAAIRESCLRVNSMIITSSRQMIND